MWVYDLWIKWVLRPGSALRFVKDESAAPGPPFFFGNKRGRWSNLPSI